MCTDWTRSVFLTESCVFMIFKLAPGPCSQHVGTAQGVEMDSVVVKVHYTYTVALSVPLDTPYNVLKKQIAQKLGQPASHLRLR